MLFGQGWPWWSARAERGELARANPAPAAVRRKLRREGAKRLAAESCLASDCACSGRAGFFRFIHCSLDWARRAPGPCGRLSVSGLVAEAREAYPGSQEGQKAKSTVKR